MVCFGGTFLTTKALHCMRFYPLDHCGINFVIVIKLVAEVQRVTTSTLLLEKLIAKRIPKVMVGSSFP